MSLSFPKPYADFVARLRVPCGFVLVAAFAWFSRPSGRSLAWGLPVALMGLLLRGWAAGHLAKNQTLATGGPYAYTRNPLYLGTLLVAAGLAIAARSWGLAGLFAVVFVGIYLPVIGLEQQHLVHLFPDYGDYAARVPVLWPRLARADARGAFRWGLYWRNREYQAAAGFLVGVVWLVFRSLLGR